jgi:2'-5' RNA ligase
VSQTDAQRLFFALNPPADVRRQVDRVRLKVGPVDARPVPAENLHITLAFLGRIENERLESLAGLMSQLPPPHTSLILDRCGWFKRARVGWIGCSSVAEDILEFQGKLVEMIRELELELDDRPWTPHITVYRKMRTRPVMVAFKPIRWDLDSYDLMVSEQRPGGVQYRSIDHRVAIG